MPAGMCGQNSKRIPRPEQMQQVVENFINLYQSYYKFFRGECHDKAKIY
jgi:hypothetical protein